MFAILFLGFYVGNSQAASLSSFYATGDTNSCPHDIYAFNCQENFVVDDDTGECKTMAEMTSLESSCISGTTHATEDRDLRCDTQCCWPTSTGLAAACDAENRNFTVCGNASGECGSCQSGFIEVDGVCILKVYTDMTDLFAEDGTQLAIGGGAAVWSESGDDVYYNDGKVGIGTALPQQNLTIHDGADNYLQITNSAAGTGSSDGLQIGINTGGQAFVMQEEDSSLFLGTGGGDKVEITEAGKVGIGTTAYGVDPVGLLHVHDGINDASFYLTNSVVGGTGSDGFAITMKEDGEVWLLNRESGGMTFYNGGNEAMSIRGSDGRVAIGNPSTPVGNLHVHETDGGEDVMFKLTNVSSGTGQYNGFDIELEDAGDVIIHQREDANDIVFMIDEYNDNEVMRIENNGNVGIGMTDPYYELEVRDPDYSAAYVHVTSDSTGSGTNDGLKLGVTSTSAYITQEENASMYFQTDGTTRMTIDEDGSTTIESDSGNDPLRVRVGGATALWAKSNEGVLIGTGSGTPPAEGLYVRGNVSVNGTTVHTSDIRKKEDIEDLSYGLDELMKLRPVSFNWKNKENEQKTIGLIAQEVEPILNEVVYSESDDGMLSLAYSGLIPVLISSIQEQQQLIDDLTARIGILENKQ